MAYASSAVATVNARPYFEKVLAYGLAEGIITPSRLDVIQADGPKGIVQIANHFGTAHLRTDLENARDRMVNLISLYLEESSGGDLQMAALALRDKSFLSLSKGGSDMLKMLHAMPDSNLIGGYKAPAEDQKNFLNDKTFASPLSIKQYRDERALRGACQQQITLAGWLGKKLGLGLDDLDSVVADTVIRSALLVLFVKEAALEIPGRTGLAKLLQAARKSSAKLDEARLTAFVASAPEDFQAAIRQAMSRFINEIIPALRADGKSADALLHGEAAGDYFVNESVTEEIGEYDQLVAKEWHRVTKGDGDDPSVVSTIFLLIATGFAPKASLLLREAKEIIQSFRKSGFSSKAVLDYIEAQAPHEMREDLKDLWLADLKPEAEIDLADLDPEMPDSHMERALRYMQTTCQCSWKGRGRK
jgi:hypothetical protein